MCVYLHGAAVALLALLHEAVPADGRSLEPEVVWFIQQAGGAALQQEFLVVVPAAAAESPRNVPAEDTHVPLRGQGRGAWAGLLQQSHLSAAAMTQLSPEHVQALESSWSMPRLWPIS